MGDDILKIIKQHDLHDYSLTVSDDNAKTEPKLTLKLRGDGLANLSIDLGKILELYSEAKDKLNEPKIPKGDP